MAAGSFEYYPSTDPWNITVINGVKYAGIVEALYGSTLWGPIPCLVPNFEGFVRDGMSILNELSKDRFWEAKSYENDIPQDPAEIPSLATLACSSNNDIMLIDMLPISNAILSSAAALSRSVSTPIPDMGNR